MAELVRRLPGPAATGATSLDDREALVTREWLVTNGLGGYASGTVSGVITRRYHGLLIAALPAPHGRFVMLSHLWERVRLPDHSVVVLSGEEHAGASAELAGVAHLEEFRLETGLPVWRYRVGPFVLEKEILLPYGQNAVHLTYRLLDGSGALRLTLRPSVHFRPHHAPVSEPLSEPYALHAVGDRFELSADPSLPSLRLALRDAPGALTVDAKRVTQVLYRIEKSRGEPATGDLWSPGYFRVDLLPSGQATTLIASTESWETLGALMPSDARSAERERRARLLSTAVPAARDGLAAELVLAADQFIVTPAGRVEDAARARAAGDDARTVIAGYHWFTDWGRDTMIGLEGLTLTTGRHREAGYILRTFAQYIHDGLIPNLFPEGTREGRYHTADATLWYFHAIDRYVRATGDRDTLRMLLPRLVDIVDRHLTGTAFGIGVDPRDGLLRQGAEGYQLTWMDAKVGDWVVTPRRGKAVEINALWYNALRLLESWLTEERGAGDASGLATHAAAARRAFNARFWYATGGYLYDVVDGERGDDSACRPNQVFAIALPHAVLDEPRWKSVLDIVETRLLTPVGLRSLAPDHPDYKARYDGDLRARDAAYHQGTVWPWLIGPFIDAWRRAHPHEGPTALRFIDNLAGHLNEAGVGTIGEIFDAEEPFMPRGCIAQAWSVGEVLRTLVTVSERPGF